MARRRRRDPAKERHWRRMVGIPEHLTGPGIDEVNEDLPSRLELPCRLEPVGEAHRVLSRVVPSALDPGSQISDGPASPGSLDRRRLRPPGRRRPSPPASRPTPAR